MVKKPVLNEQLYQFLEHYEKSIEQGKVITSLELVDAFKKSGYDRQEFDSLKKSRSSAMWWALRRSGKWTMLKRGVYQKNYDQGPRPVA
ncbi:hypothetical protein [Paenibacillus sp. BR1-192]|uniref:hypothetical protein n=1 Tax=Paenibacillus sp. BR1-192 TaxID=3032287 RepID=UPI00240E4A6B|nr:hypothetical protein [Paenibacillus sp. BR1-192]WFB59038.1 hypothetical protein P0X86_01990 [Paenibacillus sp. BR1-192]